MRDSTRIALMLLGILYYHLPAVVASFIQFTYKWSMLVILVGVAGITLASTLGLPDYSDWAFGALLVYSLFLPSLAHVGEKKGEEE